MWLIKIPLCTIFSLLNLNLMTRSLWCSFTIIFTKNKKKLNVSGSIWYCRWTSPILTKSNTDDRAIWTSRLKMNAQHHTWHQFGSHKSLNIASHFHMYLQTKPALIFKINSQWANKCPSSATKKCLQRCRLLTMKFSFAFLTAHFSSRWPLFF